MTDLRIEPDWLADASLQSILAILSADGEEARIVGGPVRNALLGLPVTDIDIATTCRPDETIRRIEAAGLKAVPTGVEHGTVTVVAEGRPFEVTTLREDIETDGRHAKVRFGKDWAADSKRRDFTINALYATATGEVIDLVGGAADIRTQTLRFIGEAEDRIREDYLRILRFFRFFAWYGRGRPDADGLRAVTRLKEGLSRLSPERVWNELRKLLSAEDPSRALLWMRQCGVLTAVLPESERWGIDTIHPLTMAEAELGWQADPLLRLMAIVPPDAARLTELSRRLRLSNAERDRLVAFAQAEPVTAEESDGSLRARLYFGDRQAIIDRLRLALATARGKPDALSEAARLSAQLSMAERFQAPPMPVTGDDLMAAGIRKGPELGQTLDRLRRAFVESGFTLPREKLLDLVKAPAD